VGGTRNESFHAGAHMSWGAVGVARYAEQMGLYAENIQGWLDKSHKDLEAAGLISRFWQIAGVGDWFDGGEVERAISYPLDDMDRQLAILSLAMANGSRFEFTDGKFANGWIAMIATGHEDNFETSLVDYLTSAEMLQFKMRM
jgi:hypothetical protein